MSETETEPDKTEPDGEEPITEKQVEEAEAEEGDDGEGSQAEGLAERAQKAAEEREIEAKHKRIDRAVTKLVTTLQTELADVAENLEPCPRCATDFPGLIWKPGIKQPLPETRAAVMISMGEDPDPTLNPDPRANRCPTCDGWGKVSTGSRVNRQDKLECSECKGRGWIGARAAELPAQTVSLAVAPSDVGYSNGDEAPQTDPWGRVKGEALYGVMPGYES